MLLTGEETRRKKMKKMIDARAFKLHPLEAALCL
jgi:hypothetical protein